MMVTNVIRNNNIDMSHFFKSNPYVRFVYPIRNPLDCAYSNVQHSGSIARMCYEMQAYDMLPMLEFVLQQLFWGVELAHQHPERVKLLFEPDMSERDTWASMAQHFGLSVDEQWISDLLVCGKVDPKIQAYNEKTIDRYGKKIEKYFRKDYPDIADRLLSFVDGE